MGRGDLILSLLLGVTLCLGASPLESQVAERTLVIGTKHSPPFALLTEEGTWEGVSIDLWRTIARELDLDYTFRELPLEELLSGVEAGTLDAAVAALTAVVDREEYVDFSHPFHITGLGIAVASRRPAGWFATVGGVFSQRILQVIGVSLVLLFAVGTLLWIFERRRNAEQFGGGLVPGLGAALWWSVVTMTTVGYGDKAPKTVGGRLVALLWMFVSIMIISGFIAGITSALTVNRLEPALNGPEDLPRVRVGTVAGTTSESYLRRQRINHRTYSSPEEGLDALLSLETEALVYDAPILRYLVKEQFPGRLVVLERTFERQDYGIALPSGSPLREPMNRIILRTIQQPSWEDVLYRYMAR